MSQGVSNRAQKNHAFIQRLTNPQQNKAQNVKSTLFSTTSAPGQFSPDPLPLPTSSVVTGASYLTTTSADGHQDNVQLAIGLSPLPDQPFNLTKIENFGNDIALSSNSDFNDKIASALAKTLDAQLNASPESQPPFVPDEVCSIQGYAPKADTMITYATVGLACTFGFLNDLVNKTSSLLPTPEQPTFPSSSTGGYDSSSSGSVSSSSGSYANYSSSTAEDYPADVASASVWTLGKIAALVICIPAAVVLGGLAIYKCVNLKKGTDAYKLGLHQRRDEEGSEMGTPVHEPVSHEASRRSSYGSAGQSRLLRSSSGSLLAPLNAGPAEAPPSRQSRASSYDSDDSY